MKLTIPYFTEKHIKLMTLINNGYNTNVKLSKETKLKPSTLSTKIDFLEKYNFVRRIKRIKPENTKEILLEVTGQGIEIIKLIDKFKRY